MKKRFCMLALLLCLLPAGGCAASSSALPPSAAAEDTTYTYTTQELYAERDGNRIYGVLYRPQDAGEKLSAVIFSHGFGGTYRVGVPYAQALAEKGYAVYCFDFCGGSYNSQSDGSPLDMSLRTEQADLEAVIRMMQELDFIDADNLFLMGTSQGGAVSAVTAADHPDEICGLILLYPAFIMAERANELFQSEEEIPNTYYFMWMEVGHDYFASLLGYDIYADIAGYDRDVLLLHGDADTIVPLSASERALESFPSASLEVLPGAGHGFSGEDESTAICLIEDYLQSHLV